MSQVRGGHRGQADLQDVVDGSIELGGPASAWGGREAQHLGQGPCPLEFVLQIPAQDDVVDGVFVCVMALIHHEEREGWGHMGKNLCLQSPSSHKLCFMQFPEFIQEFLPPFTICSQTPENGQSGDLPPFYRLVN